MHQFYGKINRGQVSRPLYRDCPLFGGSVIRGFTVNSHQVSWALPFRQNAHFACSNWLKGQTHRGIAGQPCCSACTCTALHVDSHAQHCMWTHMHSAACELHNIYKLYIPHRFFWIVPGIFHACSFLCVPKVVLVKFSLWFGR